MPGAVGLYWAWRWARYWSRRVARRRRSPACPGRRGSRSAAEQCPLRCAVAQRRRPRAAPGRAGPPRAECRTRRGALRWRGSGLSDSGRTRRAAGQPEFRRYRGGSGGARAVARHRPAVPGRPAGEGQADPGFRRPGAGAHRLPHAHQRPAHAGFSVVDVDGVSQVVPETPSCSAGRSTAPTGRRPTAWSRGPSACATRTR